MPTEWVEAFPEEAEEIDEDDRWGASELSTDALIEALRSRGYVVLTPKAPETPDDSDLTSDIDTALAPYGLRSGVYQKRWDHLLPQRGHRVPGP